MIGSWSKQENPREVFRSVQTSPLYFKGFAPVRVSVLLTLLFENVGSDIVRKYRLSRFRRVSFFGAIIKVD